MGLGAETLAGDDSSASYSAWRSSRAVVVAIFSFFFFVSVSLRVFFKSERAREGTAHSRLCERARVCEGELDRERGGSELSRFSTAQVERRAM